MFDVNTSRKLRDFTFVLYPDCLEHMNMLHYLETHSCLFKIIYIIHDRDVEEDGTPKKTHYHVYVHTKNYYSLSAFKKFFAIWIDYAEFVSSPQSLILYFLHDTPESSHKHQYLPEQLYGDTSMINKYVQVKHFVQLGDILDIVDESDGSMYSLLRNVVSTERDDLMDCVKKYQSLICTLTNQEISRRNRR